MFIVTFPSFTDWVNGIWEQDFTDNPSLPPSLEQDVADNRHYFSQLQLALDVCTPWARIDFTTLPQGMISPSLPNPAPTMTNIS